MKVFISWSGERSRAIAESLYEWLPSVIQAVQPWMSANNIEKGARWRSGLANELEQSTASIICLTPENLESPWINFEAGALSKQQQNSYVCTFLFGLEPIDLREPLAQFQSTKAEKEDIRKLVHTFNRLLGNSSLPEMKVNEAFEVWWPKLDQQLTRVRSSVRTPPVSKKQSVAGQESFEHPRDIREILSEILELVRDQNRDSKRSFAKVNTDPFVAGETLTRRTRRLLSEKTGMTSSEVERGYFSRNLIRQVQKQSKPVEEVIRPFVDEVQLNKDGKMLVEIEEEPDEDPNP